MSQDPKRHSKVPVVSAHDLLRAMQCLDGRPRLLLDRVGRLLWTSDEAITDLSRQYDICLENGQIQSRRGGRNSAMQRLLGVAEGRSEITDLQGSKKGDHVIIHAIAVGPNHVCWVLSRRNSGQFPSMKGCMGLTQSEADVVGELRTGNSAHDIAVRHHISIHTVRAHVKNIYRKFAVNCREELWAKLNTYLP